MQEVERTARVGIALAVCLALAAPARGATVSLDLQLTASTATLAGVVPGKSYRVIYAGTVSGSLAGEFTQVLNIEAESVWWPAAKVPWDSLFITTPRGTLTLSFVSARLNRGEPSDAASWSGSATWAVDGGTGNFAAATGRGTLSLTTGANPAASTHVMTATLAGTITVDAAPPTIALSMGTTRAPRLGPNGRLAVEVDVTDSLPTSGLRLVEIRGRNVAVLAINGEPVSAAPLPYRREFLEGSSQRRWTVLVESTIALPPSIEVAVADWAGNTATK